MAGLADGFGYVALQEVEHIILSRFRKIMISSFKMLKEKNGFLQVMSSIIFWTSYPPLSSSSHILIVWYFDGSISTFQLSTCFDSRKLMFFECLRRTSSAIPESDQFSMCCPKVIRACKLDVNLRPNLWKYWLWRILRKLALKLTLIN